MKTNIIANNLKCNLCDGSCESHGSYQVLGKYDAEFWQCLNCGYGFLNDPSWLEEAYTSAITSVDIGPLDRCIANSRIVKLLIDHYHGRIRAGLDYGAGYGIFTRRMRDLGYSFLWYDTYCANLFAKGFEGEITGKERYDVITAFEVLEHLVMPREALDRIISSCDSFIFSTLLISEPRPQFDQWWYYAPEHGQHISFYSKKSLQKLAEKHGKQFISNGTDFHIITNKKISERMFGWLTKRKVAALVSLFRPQPSFLGADFEAGRKRALAQTKTLSDEIKK
jgi:hypothetical protein